MGRRLDVHALCRNDGKVFYKNNLPNEIPELAVGLLLDESGSMCSCDRCTYARASAIILYDFCQSLDIPVMVYGHSTDYTDVGNTVALYSYAEFDGFDHDDKYRMMDIAARGSNRDGAALRFVAEQLSKRPEAVKNPHTGFRRTACWTVGMAVLQQRRIFAASSRSINAKVSCLLQPLLVMISRILRESMGTHSWISQT